MIWIYRDQLRFIYVANCRFWEFVAPQKSYTDHQTERPKRKQGDDVSNLWGWARLIKIWKRFLVKAAKLSYIQTDNLKFYFSCFNSEFSFFYLFIASSTFHLLVRISFTTFCAPLEKIVGILHSLTPEHPIKPEQLLSDDCENQAA